MFLQIMYLGPPTIHSMRLQQPSPELWDSIPMHLMSQTVGVTCSGKALGTAIESKCLAGAQSDE